MPDIATPPVAAPAPAAASTPAPTPSATPAPAAPPSSAPQTATSGTPVPVSTGPAKLDPKAYDNATDAYMAESAWRAQNPDVDPSESPWATDEAKAAEVTTIADGTEAPASETTETPEAKTEDATGDVEPFSMEDEGPLTPQALNDIIKSDETLKAALEANPAAKNQIFKMAREHAELAQFRGIFPTADSAKFARETADRTVSLRTKFQMAETPELMANAFDDFMQEFAIVDDKGQAVLDEHGQPQYGDDLVALSEHIVYDRYITNELADVEAELAANQFKTDADRVRAEDRKIALEILADDFKEQSAESADIDLSGITDEKVRKQLQDRAEDLKRREQELEVKTGQMPKAQREAARKENNAKYGSEVGRRTFDQVTKTVETLRKNGAAIPEWMLTTTAPGSNIPVFFAKVGEEIDKLIRFSDPMTRKGFLDLEIQAMRTPTDAVLQQRVELLDGVLQQMNVKTGKSNIGTIVTKLVRGHQQQTGAAPNANAPGESREPRTSAAPAPRQMNRDDAWKQAEALNAKEVHGWGSMTDSEKLAYNLTRVNQLAAR